MKGTSTDFRRNILLSALLGGISKKEVLLGLLGGLGAIIFSGGRMSITMQVVSSLIPRGRIAS